MDERSESASATDSARRARLQLRYSARSNPNDSNVLNDQNREIIETSPNAPGFDEGNSATGIGLDVNAITQSNGQKRLGDNVGGDGSLSSLVLETKNR